jgi:hypothetical protein
MATSESDLSDQSMVCGRVVDVRTHKSLGVTRIVIEIPSEHHVEATRLLYEKDAAVVPVALPPGSTYGVCKGNGTPNPVHPSTAAARPTKADSFRPSGSGASPFRGLKGSEIDVVAWVGARCNDPAFRAWIGVDTEEEAAQKVREICGVSSRADLRSDGPARRAALDKLLFPYTNHLREQVEQDLHA